MLLTRWFLLWMTIVVAFSKDCCQRTGSISPPGDFFMTVGKSATFNCTLHNAKESNCNQNCSHYMQWLLNGKPLDKTFTKIYTAWTIGLHLSNLNASENFINGDTLLCLYNKKVVNGLVMRVGYAPSELQSIRGVSVDLDNTTIFWEKNKDSHQSRFIVKNAESDSDASLCSITKCHDLCFCIIPDQILKTQLQYKFSIVEFNKLGNYTNYFQYIPLNNVLPSPPKFFRVINVSSRQLDLQWENGCKECKYYPQLNFHHEITYFPVIKKSLVKTFTINSNSNFSQIYHVIDLQPFQLYNFSIRSIASQASASQSLTVRTEAAVPDWIVLIDPGGFHMIKNQIVKIYWQSVPAEAMNGPNFTYIVSINGQKNREVHSAWANIKFVLNQEAIITITCKNAKGIAASSASLIIPSPIQDDKLFPCNIQVLHTSDGKSVITWDVPQTSPVLNFSVFKIQKILTDGEINWISVSGNQTSLVVNKSNRELMFYVSANFKNRSSGMKEMICSISEDQAIHSRTEAYILKNIHPFSHKIQVCWNFMDNCDFLLIQSITVSICAIGQCASKRFFNSSHIKYNFDGLISFTNYTVHVTISQILHTTLLQKTVETDSDGPLASFYPKVKSRMSRSASPPDSQPLEILPPRNFSIISIRFHFISLKWFPPEKINSQHTLIYEVSGFDKIHRTHDTSLNISSYIEGNKTYNLYLRACISDLTCSDTVELSETTPPYAPAKIAEVPNANSLQDDEVILFWKSPVPSNGNIDHYKIYYSSTIKKNETIFISNVTNITLKIQCPGRNIQVYFQVAAVNIFNGNELISERSERNNISMCQAVSSLQAYMIIIIIIAVTVVLIIGIFICFWWVNNMRLKISSPINVTLPDAIDNNEVYVSNTTTSSLFCCECFCRKTEHKDHSENVPKERKSLSRKNLNYLSSQYSASKDNIDKSSSTSSFPKYENDNCIITNKYTSLLTITSDMNPIHFSTKNEHLDLFIPENQCNILLLNNSDDLNKTDDRLLANCDENSALVTMIMSEEYLPNSDRELDHEYLGLLDVTNGNAGEMDAILLNKKNQRNEESLWSILQKPCDIQEVLNSSNTFMSENDISYGEIGRNLIQNAENKNTNLTANQITDGYVPQSMLHDCAGKTLLNEYSQITINQISDDFPEKMMPPNNCKIFGQSDNENQYSKFSLKLLNGKTADDTLYSISNILQEFPKKSIYSLNNRPDTYFMDQQHMSLV